MATGNKRYYWLKLKEDFFTSKRIKKLRRLAGGDTYTIIYLEIQLKAMQSGGIIRWTGIEDNFAAELALDLDEDEDNVKFTLAYLLKYGLAESSDNINFLFPYAVENVGSEGSSAKRMREMRKKMSEKCLPQPENQQGSVTLCAHCYGEKEKDVEIDREVDTEIDNSFNDDLDDDEPVAGIIEEFSRRNCMSVEGFEFLYKSDARTRKRVEEAAKTLFAKAVGSDPTEMDMAHAYKWIVDENQKVSNDKIYILTCAFYRAAESGHKGQWNYIEAILGDMYAEGVKTKEDATNYFYSRKDDA